MGDMLLVTSGLVFVICLMVGFAYLVKKFGFSENSTGFLNPYQPKNLKILEQLPIDTRRRLLLVKAGDKNHLIMLGQQSETLIDSNVKLTERDNKNASKKA